MGQSDFLAWFERMGGWHEADEVAEHFSRERRNTQKTLAKLVKNGDLEVERPGKNQKYRYRFINRDQTDNSLGLAAQESQTDSKATG